MPLYDESGNEIEGALTPEEASEIKAKAEEYEAKQKELQEKEESFKTMEEEIKKKEEDFKKLQGKDLNFKRLREKSEAEIEELKKKMTEKERMFFDEIQELSNERDQERTKRMTEAKREILENLAGSDKELQKSIEAAEKDLNGEAVTPSELEERFRKAYILAKGVTPQKNPIFSGYASSYNEPNVQAKRFTDTERGQAVLKDNFPDFYQRLQSKNNK